MVKLGVIEGAGRGRGLLTRDDLQAQAARGGRVFALASPSGLSAVNRIEGTAAGDLLIARLQRALESAGAPFCRFAGAKFAVLLEAEDELAASEALADLCELLLARGVDAHVGAIWSDRPLRPDAAPLAAQEALIEAKRTPRRGAVLRIAEAGAPTSAADAARDALAALAAGAVRISRQPVVDVNNAERVLFSESLVRVLRADGEIIPAGQFMPALTAAGMTAEIDIAALDEAIEALDNDPVQRFSVNVGGATLMSQRWRDRLMKAILLYPDAAERLILEISEETPTHLLSEAEDVLRLARRAGVALALDDFGAGRTSFRHLRDLRFDIVKIDGGFVRDLDQSPADQAVIAAMVDFANRMDMMVVAEAVETAREARCLRDLGVHGLQGFLFGRPTLVWSEEQDAARA